METFDCVDEVLVFVLSELLKKGSWVCPRDLKTLEITPFAVALSNPRCRCVMNPERRWSLPLALGEFCWHANASRELAPLEYYAPRWREFSDDGYEIRGSCYGYRIFGPTAEGPSQWQRIKTILQSDMCSRRAVLYFEASTTQTPHAKDVACASTVQFLVRGGKLHAFVSMRSNDAIWGLPYDIFLFTMLQELLACELQIPLGQYWHCVGSMHLYQRHVEKAEGMLRSSVSEKFEMPPMSHPDQVPAFLDSERVTRIGGDVAEKQMPSLSTYWVELLKVLEWYAMRKRGSIVGKTPPDGVGRYAALIDGRTLISKATSA